jgi:hypothetical protein
VTDQPSPPTPTPPTPTPPSRPHQPPRRRINRHHPRTPGLLALRFSVARPTPLIPDDPASKSLEATKSQSPRARHARRHPSPAGNRTTYARRPNSFDYTQPAAESPEPGNVNRTAWRQQTNIGDQPIPVSPTDNRASIPPNPPIDGDGNGDGDGVARSLFRSPFPVPYLPATTLSTRTTTLRRGFQHISPAFPPREAHVAASLSASCRNLLQALSGRPSHLLASPSRRR